MGHSQKYADSHRGWKEVCRPIEHPVEGNGMTLAFKNDGSGMVAVFESGELIGFTFEKFALECTLKEVPS